MSERPTRRRQVLTGATGAAVAAALAVRGQGSELSAQASTPAAAGRRRLELPGLVDLQVNGFAGADFSDPATSAEDLARAAAALEKTGVTRFLPTLITSSTESFSTCARLLARATLPAVAGIHMEGPYISPQDGYRGAHAREHVRAADVDDFKRRQDAAEGKIRLVTLAPEVGGALGLIEHLVAAGVRVELDAHVLADGQILAGGLLADIGRLGGRWHRGNRPAAGTAAELARR